LREKQKKQKNIGLGFGLWMMEFLKKYLKIIIFGRGWGRWFPSRTKPKKSKVSTNIQHNMPNKTRSLVE